ncbi:PREDICTED: ubiquitin receptor RAD23d-like isoform X4 [Brassica oleracea var. oleracea]|uniref:ubiquitin receptor RAD23d-like isoform X4 n=1 Tax=Brassica oleracea var. oleracea TaxID=109376 RepID=UPI0006A6B691|nr:PREDICTED: ubiquitin receptor RAD23d-like isoform X4 [Brassica oleracea var. oleracea]
MRIFVKTLKGDRFEIQVNLEDLVADVKKNIETVMGVTAEEQMLIHKGKVLKDETTLEANNVSEKSIIGVIKRKPASTATSTSTETPTERASAGASYVASERVSESSIQKILGMVGGGWDRYMELPGQSEDPYIAEDQTQEHEAPTEADELRFFDFLNGTPEQEYLRALARSDPSIIKDFVEMLEEQDPPLFVLIQDNKALFLRLLLEVEGGACGNEMDQPHEHQAVQTNESNNGGDGDNQVGGESEETKVEELQADQTNKPNNGVDGGNQVVGESEETKVEVANPEDNELIEQLEALGFERGDAEVAYFACNKNVQEAANHLLGHKHESQE